MQNTANYPGSLHVLHITRVPLITTGQEMRLAYSATLPSPHGAT